MGSDSTKVHEAFAVAPADPDEPADEPGVLEHPPATDTPLGKFAHTLGLIEGLPFHSDEAHFLEDLSWLMAAASQDLDAADLSQTDREHADKQVAAAAAAALAALPPEQLQQHAAAQGFAHPTLVSAGALAHWLNPTYPADAASKAKIQAKAGERYAQLAAGDLDELAGQTLADVHAADAKLTPGPGGEIGWQASPAEVALSLAEVNQRLADLEPGGDADGGLVALLAAERRLHTAACPDMDGADLAAAKAAVSDLIDKQLATLPAYQRRAMVAAAVEHAAGEGAISDAQARWLDRDAQLALLRAATPASVCDHLKATASERAQQVAALADARAAVDAAGGSAPAGPEAITDWAVACGQAHVARTTVAAWAGEAADHAAFVGAGVASPWALKQAAKQRTSQWRAWAKQQPIATLRDAAGALGLDQAKHATRAQLQNAIAAAWDPTLDKAVTQQQVAAKAATGPAATPPAKKTAAPAPTAPQPAAGGVAGGSWAAKHAAAVAALKAHQALAADVPEPRSAEDVVGLKLSAAKRANVGGMHRKSLHTDPDGGAWLHKPDSSGGARAHAEAAAARLHHLAGVRTPPVYVRDVGGKPGSLQPWIGGAEQLPADPGQWSQAEVDSLVRFHVAAWTCSNHDGNAANVLRTPSGGLTPIDHGQAWRYFGADRLAVDYDPNAAYGNPPPAHLAAYKAAAAGALALGVRIRPEAALPVITAFERLPDAAFRADLAPVAASGVKAGLPWVPRMRKAAAKRLGTPTVSDEQVAEEFLRQAVARKQRLRADFAAFFTGLGLAGDRLEQVA